MRNERLIKLYKTNWLSWRGKAGGFAKSKNPKLLLANKQKERYFLKYANEAGITTEEIAKAFKNRLV